METRWLSRAFDLAIDGLAYICGGLLALTAVGVTYDVAMRYLFARPAPWIADVSEYILFYSAFLVAPWVLKLDGHVKIDIVLRFLPPRAQNVLTVITSVLGLFAVAVLFWQGMDTTLDSFGRGVRIIRTVQLPQYVVLAVVPVGSLLMAIQFARRGWGSVRELTAHAPQEPIPAPYGRR